MNIAQVKTELKDRGIDFRPNAAGDKLVDLLNDTLAAAGEELVTLDGVDSEPEADAEAPKKPLTKAQKDAEAKRKEPGPHKDTKPSGAEAAIKNTSVPAIPTAKQKRKSFLPNVKAKEYKNLKLVKGETVRVLMLGNVNNGDRFKMGTTYIVTKEIAEQFITEGWAE